MVERFRNKYRVDSARLKGYDYTRNGNYFKAICTKFREPLFGVIVCESFDFEGKSNGCENSNNVNAKIKLSIEGKIVTECWFDLPNHYSNIILDEFIVMPNHIHGIIRICNHEDVKRKHGIPEFIRAFKSFSSRRINRYYEEMGVETGDLGGVETGLRPVSTHTHTHTHTPAKTQIWQPRYYDRIIRSQNELEIIRLYIKNNPIKFHGTNSFV